MTTYAGGSTLPMKAAGTEHLIERTYRESGVFQWVRETYVNAEEAGATRIEFGIEWQGVETLGVYRRTICDDGRGMTADELVEFFNTFGGGGKPIGGAHENFGVGSKTSLLPWNRYGMVVVSWVDGDASMIWVQQDAATGEYGLRLVDAVDPDTGEVTIESVYEPFDDPEHGCDWSKVRPSWLTDHGTVVVLLGNDPAQDTVLGDPNRAEADIKGISAYLNRRFWAVGQGRKVTVDELRSKDRATWPRSELEGGGGQPSSGPDRRTNTRTIEGAAYFIEYPPGYKSGEISSGGTVILTDGTEIDWYLWEGERPAVQSYAAIGGYIGALYRNELYDIATHHSTYRMFGISEAVVRKNLWLIIRPVELDDEGRHGVYPRTDRNSLLLRGGPSAGQGLPLEDWAADFADDMPEELRVAIKAARSSDSGSLDDNAWRDRLAERFGSRWRISKLRFAKGGTESVETTQPGATPRQARRAKKKERRNSGGGGGGLGGAAAIGSTSGPRPASKTKVAGGIPTYRTVGEDDLGKGMLAAWQPHDPEYPEGVVLLNRDHPVLREQIEHWQGQYADHHAEDIERDVLAAYGEVAVSKVAHSEHLKSLLPSHIIETELRSETALTMALLGIIAEESLIAPRIGGKYAKRRTAS